jgi:hypothetical protein
MKKKPLTVEELMEALLQFDPKAEVVVHAEMSMLVECPVIGVRRAADAADQWQAIIEIKEMEEEDEAALQAILN